MNIEEKAKAYDEALERAKKLQKTCDSQAVVGWCEYIFPELKESEDEKIKKRIIQAIKIREKEMNEEWSDEIAWLEKQGSIDIDIESMVSSYKQRLKSQGQGNLENNPLINMCVSAFKQGVENTLEELNLKKL